MTAPEIAAHKAKIEALVARWDAAPNWNKRSETEAEILMALDLVREVIRPVLYVEFEAAKAAAAAAMLEFQDGNTHNASRAALHTPAVHRLLHQADSFGSATRVLIDDARKAVSVLATL